MACAMWAQEVETRRCFTCNQPGHLQRDHWKYEGKNWTWPLQLKGPPQNKSAQERAFAATIAESEDDTNCCQESSPQEGADSFGAESSQEDDEGLFIPSYLEQALPDDPTLQVKMACAMWAQEVETRRCFTCNQPGHLQRDHWKYEGKNWTGPLQLKGPPQNKSAQERAKPKPPQPS